MKLSELNKNQITPLGVGTSGFSLQTQPAQKSLKLSELSGARGNLVNSQKAVDASKVFQSPLTNIASGNGADNLDVAKGGFMQGVKDFFSAGAQNAGPIGADMMAHAPAFAANVQGLTDATTPQNTSQAVGMGQTQLAEMFLGGGKALGSLAEGTGLAKFFASRKDAKALRSTIDAITPKLTTGEMEEAGRLGRVTTPKRGAPRADFSGDKQYQDVAKDVKGIVEGKDPNIDIHNLRNVVEDTSKNVVEPHLAQNKVPFNFEDFQNKMSLVKPTLSLKQDANAVTKYNYIRERVLERVYGSLKSAAKKQGDFTAPTDFNDVWKARQMIDNVAEEELKTQTFGTPEYTGAKAAIQDMRQGLSDFIKDSLRYPGQMEQVNKLEEFVQVARSKGIEIDTPEKMHALLKQMGIETGAEDIVRAATFEKAMKRLTNYYKAIDNISTKIPDYIRENSSFAKRNPLKSKAGELGLAATGLGVAGGLGGAIYNKVTGD